MTEMIVGISYKKVRNSTLTLGAANAWAAYVRRRWPTNTLAQIQSEWDLSESQARTLLYANGSLRTFDQILNHKNGGPSLALKIWEIRFEVTLEQYIEQQAENARNERAKFEAREQYLARLQSRVSDDSRLERLDA